MKWIFLIASCSSSAAWSQAVSTGGDAAPLAILNHIHVVNGLDKTLAFYETEDLRRLPDK